MKNILIFFGLIAIISCNNNSTKEKSINLDSSKVPEMKTVAITCNKIDVVLNNRNGVEMKGCVLIGYEANGTEHKDGVRPVAAIDGVLFTVRGNNMTHWRWIGAVDYSDRPENTDVVLVDTKKRILEKCDYTITARPGHSKIQESSNGDNYDIE